MKILVLFLSLLMFLSAPVMAQDDPYGFDDPFAKENAADPFEEMKRKNKLYQEKERSRDDAVKFQKPKKPYELENSFAPERPRYKSLSDTVADQLKERN